MARLISAHLAIDGRLPGKRIQNLQVLESAKVAPGPNTVTFGRDSQLSAIAHATDPPS
jgi:hypothetical protein